MKVQPEELPEGFGQAEARFTERYEQVAEWLKSFDPEQIDKSAMYAMQDELDKLWPYMDELCYISGEGFIPQFDETGRWIDEGRGRLEGMGGISKGIAIKLLPGDEYYRPYYFFSLRNTPHGEAYTHDLVSRNCAYMENTANIVPTDIVDTVFDEPKDRSIKVRETLMEDLQSYSDWFKEQLKSSAFRRQRREDQLQFVEDFMGFCQEKFNIHRAGATFQSLICCRPVFAPAEGQPEGSPPVLTQEFVPVNNQIVHCVVRGFDSLERMTLQERPLRRDYDMYDPQAGLCVAVEIMEQSPDSYLRASEIVLVPLSSQPVQLHLKSADEAANQSQMGNPYY